MAELCLTPRSLGLWEGHLPIRQQERFDGAWPWSAPNRDSYGLHVASDTELRVCCTLYLALSRYSIKGVTPEMA